MKLIALLPFKNEEWILPAYLSSVAPVVDEIVAVDDGSTDRSRNLVQAAGGFVQSARAGGSWETHWGWIREDMLQMGRERGGTHFLCLDADEALTAPAQRNIRGYLADLEPGHKLVMQWLALWKDPLQYRDDGSAWSNSFKDFAFADDGQCSFVGQWPHQIGRTPGPNDPNLLADIPADVGAVLHYQFVPWRKFEAKQAWYRCAELIRSPDGSYAINQMYAPTLDEPEAGSTQVPQEWLMGVDVPAGMPELRAAWHMAEILGWFDEYGVTFFEPVQIWHVPELRERFISEVGRDPKPNTALNIAGRLGHIWRSRFASRS
jgi:hypothetical protein